MRKEECLRSAEHEKTAEEAKANVLSQEEIVEICNIFRVLGETSRMKIVLALLSGEMCVYHIVRACGGMQSAVSHQLRVLKDNKIVKSRREGQSILYSIADEHVRELIKIGEIHLRCQEE